MKLSIIRSAPYGFFKIRPRRDHVTLAQSFLAALVDRRSRGPSRSFRLAPRCNGDQHHNKEATWPTINELEHGIPQSPIESQKPRRESVRFPPEGFCKGNCLEGHPRAER